MSQYHYFDQLLTVLEEHVEFTSSAFGIPKQLFTAAAATVVGGMIGGPLGAMVGGAAGLTVTHLWSQAKTPIIDALKSLNNEQKETVVRVVQTLVGATPICSFLNNASQKKALLDLLFKTLVELLNKR